MLTVLAAPEARLPLPLVVGRSTHHHEGCQSRQGCQRRSRVGALAGAGSGEGLGCKGLSRKSLRRCQRAASFPRLLGKAREGCQTPLATLAINFPLVPAILTVVA